MAVKIGIANVAANTATGVQEITCNEAIGTPKAVMFVVTAATVNGTVADHAIMSMGACDGTNECVVSSRSKDASNLSVENKRGATDECIQCLATANDNVDGEATGVGDGAGSNPGPITNGWRINWGNALASAYRIAPILFSGVDKAWVNTFTSSTQLDGYVDVNCGPDPYWVPDLILFFSQSQAFDDTTYVTHRLSFGAAAKDSGQCCMNTYANDNMDTTSAYDVTRNNRVVQNIYQTTKYGDIEIDFASNPNGFRAYTRRTAENPMGFLALKLTPGGTVKAWVGNLQSPTSTGNWAKTDPGFTPQFVMMGINRVDADDTVQQATNPITFGIAAFNTTDEVCASITNEDAVGTSQTTSHLDNNAVDLYQDDGSTQLFLGTWTSMDALGFTINFTTVDTGGAREWFGIAIEEDEAEEGVAGPLVNRGARRVSLVGGGLAG